MLFYPLKDALKKVISPFSTVWLCVIEGKYSGQKQDILIFLHNYIQTPKKSYLK